MGPGLRRDDTLSLDTQSHLNVVLA